MRSMSKAVYPRSSENESVAFISTTNGFPPSNSISPPVKALSDEKAYRNSSLCDTREARQTNPVREKSSSLNQRMAYTSQSPGRPHSKRYVNALDMRSNGVSSKLCATKNTLLVRGGVRPPRNVNDCDTLATTVSVPSETCRKLTSSFSTGSLHYSNPLSGNNPTISITHQLCKITVKSPEIKTMKPTNRKLVTMGRGITVTQWKQSAIACIVVCVLILTLSADVSSSSSLDDPANAITYGVSHGREITFPIETGTDSKYLSVHMRAFGDAMRTGGLPTNSAKNTSRYSKKHVRRPMVAFAKTGGQAPTFVAKERGQMAPKVVSNSQGEIMQFRLEDLTPRPRPQKSNVPRLLRVTSFIFGLSCLVAISFVKIRSSRNNWQHV